MPGRITLICHGRTTARPSSFPDDAPLAAGEREKIVELARRIGIHDRVLTSPAQAAWQTAELIDQDFTFDPALADIDLGRWAGRKIADIQASEPESLAEWLENPDFAPYGGESRTLLLARVSAWLEGRLPIGGHTVAVTHPHVVRTAVVSILGAPAAAAGRIDVEHLFIADLRSDGRRWVLRSLSGL